MSNLLNTTVITLKWSCHKELFDLLDKIPKLKNFNEYENERIELKNFYIPKQDKTPVYSDEKLKACMQVFDCHGKKHGRRRDPAEARQVIWHYVLKTFTSKRGTLKKPSLLRISKASVSPHEKLFNHATILHAVKKVDVLLESDKKIKELKKEVYAVCEEIFFGKSETLSEE